MRRLIILLAVLSVTEAANAVEENVLFEEIRPAIMFPDRPESAWLEPYLRGYVTARTGELTRRFYLISKEHRAEATAAFKTCNARGLWDAKSFHDYLSDAVEEERGDTELFEWHSFIALDVYWDQYIGGCVELNDVAGRANAEARRMKKLARERAE